MEKLICKICEKECNGFKGLSSHLIQNHKNQISLEDYYDKYLKKDVGEGICSFCGGNTKFTGLRGGYNKFCSCRGRLINKEIIQKKLICQFEIDGKKCGRECNGWGGLSSHISQTHKNEITLRDYYIKYLRKDNTEGFCSECGKNSSLISLNYGCHKYCSKKCSTNNEITQSRYIQTNIIKLGVPYPTQNKEVVKKGKQKSQKNWGCNHYMKSKEGRERYKQGILKNRGIDNIFRDVKYIEKCVFKKYGVGHATKLKKVVDKIKLTRIKNGTRLPDDQYSNFEIYYQSVSHFSNISLKKKYTKEELEKRKRVNSGLHADHRFSIFEGFKQNILPCIIGCQSNLELLLGRDNLKKHSKCSISKEELFELYEQEINLGI